MNTKRKPIPRTTPSGMLVRIGRANSMGLQGTFENMEHHARGCRELVEALVAAAEMFPFKEWVQGHNVHKFVTHDGRIYRFRPLHVRRPEHALRYDPSGYIGLELFQEENDVRTRILQITDPEDVALCISLMHNLSRSRFVNSHSPAVAETA